ncbi:MAG: cytochrome P450 [Xanthobacteraceae bacterium]|nr:cytochrome P450 [Xanthobacteraceae bacterium]
MATTVNMFWHGGALPSYARACIRSFLERGHRVRLHAYGSLDPPPGVEPADAALVMSVDDLPRYRSIAAFADAFRYELLHKQGGWWVDADVVCLTDRLPETDYAWAEQEPGLVNVAVLKFPSGDEKLAQLAAGARAAADDPNWGATGPHLISKVLHGFEPPGRAGTSHQFYPLHWLEAPLLLLPEYKSELQRRTKGALFLHLWAHELRHVGIRWDGDAPRGSLMHDLLGPDADDRATWWRELKTRRAIDKYWRQSWVRDLWRRRFDGSTPPRVMGVRRRRIRTRLSAAVTGLRYALHARICRATLPPGGLDPSDRSMDLDQRYVMKAAARFGPVFKTWWHGRYTTCVIGHARGRRLVAENEDVVVPRSIELPTLVPKGWIRAMRGDTHQHYRRVLLRAFQAVPVSAHADDVRQIVRDNLAALSRAPRRSHQEIRATLRTMTSTIMLMVLFGVPAGSKEFGNLMQLYRRFGSEHPVRHIEAQAGAAFAGIVQCVERMARAMRSSDAGAERPSALRQLVESGSDDPTAVGNLAYLFEPAHFDVYSLWHWVLWHLAMHQHAAERIATALTADKTEANALIEAVILETLRLEQSEVLYREVKSDVTFDGMFFPQDTIVRLCLWESHKDDRVFPEPFAYRPERFVGRRYDADAFAPFGLDKHRCLGADLTMSLTALFVEELVSNFICTVDNPGAAQLGPYHWEPNLEAKISFSPRAAGG